MISFLGFGKKVSRRIRVMALSEKAVIEFLHIFVNVSREGCEVKNAFQHSVDNSVKNSWRMAGVWRQVSIQIVGLLVYSRDDFIIVDVDGQV